MLANELLEWVSICYILAFMYLIVIEYFSIASFNYSESLRVCIYWIKKARIGLYTFIQI